MKEQKIVEQMKNRNVKGKQNNIVFRLFQKDIFDNTCSDVSCYEENQSTENKTESKSFGGCPPGGISREGKSSSGLAYGTDCGSSKGHSSRQHR